MFSSLKRIIKWGFQSFARNSGASFATTSVMLVVLILVTSLYLLNYLTDFTVTQLQEKIALSVYFKSGADEEDILKAKRELEKDPNAERVEYISREEALNIFSQRHERNMLIQESLAMVGGNPLLAHLNIKAKNTAAYQSLSESVGQASFSSLVDHFNYAQVSPIIERIEKIAGGLSAAGLVLAIIFGAIAVLVTFNTVRLAIYNLREEIGVMRLVGAANFFIRGPLLFQAVLTGAIAMAAALLLFSIGLSAVSGKLAALAPGLDLFGYFKDNILRIVGLQLASGVGLGLFSSWIAMRRYLMV